MGLGLNNNYESKPMCQPPLMRKINSWSSIWLVRNYLTFLIWMGNHSYSFRKKVFVGLNLTVSCYWQKFPPWAKVPPLQNNKNFHANYDGDDFLPFLKWRARHNASETSRKKLRCNYCTTSIFFTTHVLHLLQNSIKYPMRRQFS